MFSVGLVDLRWVNSVEDVEAVLPDLFSRQIGLLLWRSGSGDPSVDVSPDISIDVSPDVRGDVSVDVSADVIILASTLTVR